MKNTGFSAIITTRSCRTPLDWEASATHVFIDIHHICTIVSLVGIRDTQESVAGQQFLVKNM